MNPDDQTTATVLTRLARLFQKHAAQAEARERIKGDHRKRGSDAHRKHRRQISSASKRRNR